MNLLDFQLLDNLIASPKIALIGRGLRSLKFIFTPLALCFILLLIWRTRFDSLEYLAKLDLFYLVSASFFLFLAHCISPFGSRQILAFHGLNVPYAILARTHFARLPARYLPGGVWHTVGRAIDLKSYGVGALVLTRMVIFENVFAIAMALFLGCGLLLPFSIHTDILWIKYVFVILLCTSIVMLLVVKSIVKHFLIGEFVDRGSRDLVGSILVFALVWIFNATAFVFFFTALLGRQDAIGFIKIAGTYLFSWAVGLAAFFAPQGIGVFEVITGFLLSKDTLFNAVTLAAGFRIVMLATDLFSWCVFSILFAWFPKNKNKTW